LRAEIRYKVYKCWGWIGPLMLFSLVSYINLHKLWFFFVSIWYALLTLWARPLLTSKHLQLRSIRIWIT
jgi:hypothetical protein